MDIRQIWYRVMNMFSIGRVTAPADSGNIQTVQYQTPLEVASAKRMADFGFSSSLPVGTDVVIAFLGGDRSNAVIIGSNHQTYRHQNLLPGESVIYSQWGQYIKLTESGIEINAAGQPVVVNDATTAEIHATESVTLKTPLLLVTGDIIDNSESNGTTMKQLRDAYNRHTHQITGVDAGDSTVTSQEPEQSVK